MLVLTRKSKQKISINNKKIVITILKVQGDQVTIGFEAPPEELIHRMELLEEIEKQNTDGAIRGDKPSDVKSLADSLNLKKNKKSKTN